MRRLSVIKLTIAWLATAAVTCWGQDRGTIVGRVTDPSSALIAGANITVTNQDTGFKISACTNETGNYTVSGLAYGKYELICGGQGLSQVRPARISTSMSRRP